MRKRVITLFVCSLFAVSLFAVPTAQAVRPEGVGCGCHKNFAPKGLLKNLMNDQIPNPADPSCVRCHAFHD